MPTEFVLVFPWNGLDVAREFGRQPAGTSPDAENVRAFDTLAERKRGGSRHGLTKYVNETVNGDTPVQHLNILVDPTTPAVDAEADGGDVVDPSTNNLRVRNPGRTVRQGGSGRPTNRNIGDGSTALEFVSSANNNDPNPEGTDPVTATLASPVASGRLLVAFIVIDNTTGTPQGEPTVTNGDGTPYTMVDSVSSTYFFSGSELRSNTVWVFTLVATGAAGDQEVTSTPQSGASSVVVLTHWKGQNAIPLGPVATDSVNSVEPPTAVTSITIPVTVTVNPSIIVAFVNADNRIGSIAGPNFPPSNSNGYTAEIQGARFLLFYKEVSAGESVELTDLTAEGFNIYGYSAVAFAIKD